MRPAITTTPVHEDSTMIWTPSPARHKGVMLRLAGWLLAVVAGSTGCASLTNPTAYEGIPVNRVPDEVLGRPRSELQALPLNLLRQPDPKEYRVDKGDVLGVVAEQILGQSGQQIPVQFNPNPTAARPAVLGYPIPVQDNGTIILPQLPPIQVKGLTLTDVQKTIAGMMTGDKNLPGAKEIVVPGTERVLVDIIQPRRFQILVVREDAAGSQVASSGFAVQGANRRGAGFSIYLDAYKNDVLRALNATGGLPGVDAKNEVIIRRGQFDPADPDKGFVRIPMRARPDEPITFTDQDITLNEGDTLYIEARDTETYYTGGLLGGAQIPLPRDYDLRILEAIAQVRGPLFNGGFSQTAFVAQSVSAGVGRPNPSLVSVIRRLPNQQTITLRVDLNRASFDQRENILVQPGDLLVMQERPGEALVRYLTETLRLSTIFTPINTTRVQQTATATFP